MLNGMESGADPVDERFASPLVHFIHKTSLNTSQTRFLI